VVSNKKVDKLDKTYGENRWRFSGFTTGEADNVLVVIIVGRNVVILTVVFVFVL